MRYDILESAFLWENEDSVLWTFLKNNFCFIKQKICLIIKYCFLFYVFKNKKQRVFKYRFLVVFVYFITTIVLRNNYTNM